MSTGASTLDSFREQGLRPLLGALSGLLPVVIHVAFSFWIIRLYRIEESYGFDRIVPLVFAGFLVHALIPLRWRPAFFVALSLAAVGVVLGLPSAVYLVALVGVLFGLAHLPAPFSVRVALIAVVALYLAVVRGQWLDVPGSYRLASVVPILAAMMMFRLVLYLYEVRHEKKPAPVLQRLSYFLLLPNPCFPLFPVVDYQRFKTSYYDRPDHEIYRKGGRWIFRGVAHLLLYRFVYHFLTPSPAAVTDLAGVALYVVSSYLLYLRISGLFHLIIGVLCLFGYDLPATHRHYFLASSINDFWRRINIYWKDFMTKVVYYPIFMRLRKGGLNRAIAIATLATLLVSWPLHSYQWFWLRGTFPLTVQDAVFWTLLGALVALNSVLEARATGAGRPKDATLTFASAFRISLQTVGMFTFMCVLWSFWTSRTVTEWFSVVSVAASASLGEFLVLAVALLGLVLAGVIAQFARARGFMLLSSDDSKSSGEPFRVPAFGALAVLALLGTPELQSRLGIAETKIVRAATGERLNERDTALLTRGYYEELLGVESYTSALWSVKRQTPKDWVGMRESEAAREVDNLLVYDLEPSKESVFKRALLRTNRWGLRDRDYDQDKPPGTVRIALLGASYGMGSGVANDETFESLAEGMLNESPNDGRPRYEILNFCVGGYSVLQSVFLMEEKVFDFEPDVVMQIATTNHAEFVEARFRDLIRKGTKLPPYLEEIRVSAGVSADMDSVEIHRRLMPFVEDVTAWAYGQIAEQSRSRGAVPVWLYVPRTENGDLRGSESAMLEQMAENAGFRILSLEGAYGNRDPRSLWIAPWDEHPNAEGHRLLAEKLTEVFRASESELGITNGE